MTIVTTTPEAGMTIDEVTALFRQVGATCEAVPIDASHGEKALLVNFSGIKINALLFPLAQGKANSGRYFSMGLSLAVSETGYSPVRVNVLNSNLTVSGAFLDGNILFVKTTILLMNTTAENVLTYIGFFAHDVNELFRSK